MLVTPWTCSVAAVARIMKKAIRLEKPIPTNVSMCSRRRWDFRLSWGDAQRFVGSDALDFFDFLLRLPEEQIGTDRRAQDGDDRRHVVLVPVDRRE